MIGLIRKDLYCLKKNLLLFIAVTVGIIVLGVMFTVSAQSGNIADGVAAMKAEDPAGEKIFYSVFQLGIAATLMIPIAFIGMTTECFKEDDKAHFYRYAMTFPVKEAQLVGSRFLAMLLFGAVGICGSLLAVLFVSFASDTLALKSLICCILVFAAVLLTYMSIVFFLLYCFGAKRADLVQCIPVVGIVLAADALFSYRLNGLTEEEAASFMMQLPDKLFRFMERFGVVIFLAALGVTGLSFIGSCIVTRKRRGCVG